MVEAAGRLNSSSKLKIKCLKKVSFPEDENRAKKPDRWFYFCTLGNTQPKIFLKKIFSWCMSETKWVSENSLAFFTFGQQ